MNVTYVGLLGTCTQPFSQQASDMASLLSLSKVSQHQIAFSSPPIVFVGDGGAGKTTTAVSAATHAIKNLAIKPQEIVVVANDTYNAAFGGAQFIIDGELFPKGVRVIRIVECGCCESINDMESRIREAYRTNPFKMLLIEAVPGAEPAPLVAAFKDRFGVRPTVVGIINADELHPDRAFREHLVSAADQLLVTRSASRSPALGEIREVISALRNSQEINEQLTMVTSSSPNDLPTRFFESLTISRNRSLVLGGATHDLGDQFGLTLIIDPDVYLKVGEQVHIGNRRTGAVTDLKAMLSSHRRAKGYLRSMDGLHYYLDYTNDLSGGNLKLQPLLQPISIHNNNPFLRIYSRGVPVDAKSCVGLGMPFLDVKLLGKYRYPDQQSFLKQKGEVATSWRADALYAQGQPFVSAESTSPQYQEFKQNWITVLDAWMKFRIDGVRTLLAVDPTLSKPWSPRAAVELGMDINSAVVWYGNTYEVGESWYASLLSRTDLNPLGIAAIKGQRHGGLGVAKLLFEAFGKLDAVPRVLRDKTYAKLYSNAESFGPQDPDMFFIASALMAAQVQGLCKASFTQAVENVVRLFKECAREEAALRWVELLEAGQAIFDEV